MCVFASGDVLEMEKQHNNRGTRTRTLMQRVDVAVGIVACGAVINFSRVPTTMLFDCRVTLSRSLSTHRMLPTTLLVSCCVSAFVSPPPPQPSLCGLYRCQ